MEPRFILVNCKRDDYIKAWNHMYKSKKDVFNHDPLYKDINPSLNKTPLKTETDNFCTVVYDSLIPTEGFTYGKPVGIFCFVITPSKNIGKQFVVHPDYTRKGLGKALLLEAIKTLIHNGYTNYYIGCSKCSSGIHKSFGLIPYNEDFEHDMFKYNVDIYQGGDLDVADLYDKYVLQNKNIKII